MQEIRSRQRPSHCTVVTHAGLLVQRLNDQNEGASTDLADHLRGKDRDPSERYGPTHKKSQTSVSQSVDTHLLVDQVKRGLVDEADVEALLPAAEHSVP